MVTVALEDVFTPGGNPDVTYNPRTAQEFEKEIGKFIKNHRGSVLTVSGPSKSGKTVVIKRFFPEEDVLWISGADIKNIDDFWKICADHCNVWPDISRKSGSRVSQTHRVSGNLGAAGVANIGGDFGGGTEESGEITESAQTPLGQALRKELNSRNARIVIDDFHYVAEGVREDLIHAIKWLVAGCKVILIAVPQEAFRVMQVEPEMVGRAWSLPITSWSQDELAYIAEAGFRALNISDDSGLISEFAKESRGAPLLMQLLCLEVCEDAGIEETQTTKIPVGAPPQYDTFYRRVANRNVPGVFSALKAGPRSKGQPRLARNFRSGVTTDIYGAILYGISQMDGDREISTQALGRIISAGIIDVQPPTLQQISSALGKMKEIAADNRGKSDAALDYVDDRLYIADPFLAFYISHGSWDYPKPPDFGI
ncbi:hypothetical protein [Luteococcus peritonei]|uniref:ATP-binding protein n=1 Tax=Luteococcus peritonei TaxID=88874 RepID=A0ABW4RWQ5_9ACTN